MDSSDLFTDTTTSPSTSSGATEALGLGIAGGYISLTALIPVFIGLITLFLFIILFILAALSTRMREITEQLENLNTNTLLGQVSTEAYLDPKEEEKVEAQKASSTRKQVTVISFGAVVGLVGMIGGLSAEDEFVRMFLIAVGATVVVVSIIVPVGEKFLGAKRNTETKPEEPSIAPDTTPVEDSDSKQPS